MKAFWTYTALRLALFAATAAVLFGGAVVLFDQVDLLLVVLAAAVLSSVLSWRLLSGPRARFAASVDARAARASQRFEDLRAKEDQDVPSAAPRPSSPPSPQQQQPRERGRQL